MFGGTLSEAFAEKICKVMDLAVKYGCPLIGINDSGGARIQEGVVSLGGYAEIFWRNVQASGVIPQISLVMGPMRRRRRLLAGHDRLHPHGQGDLVHVHHRARGREDGDRRGGHVRGARRRDTHASKSGVAHFAAPRRGGVPRGRALPALVPAAEQPRAAAVLRADRSASTARTPELDAIVPDELEQAVRHARGRPPRRGRRGVPRGAASCGRRTSCAASRGSAGIPSAWSGTARARSRATLDIDSSVKAARFVRTCDAFNIPLVTFVDVPGFLPGTEQEWGGIIRHGAKLLYAYCGGDRAEDRGDHAQGVRRRVRRDELEAHPRRLQLRVADRRGGRDGAGGRGEHRVPQGAGGRPTTRRRAAPS